FDVSVMMGWYWSNDRNIEEYKKDNFYFRVVSIERRTEETEGWDNHYSQWCVRGSDSDSTQSSAPAKKYEYDLK
ncbi:MAG: hypothetical protein Q7T83_02905, partial [Thermodesulfovibrionales bacterium]|nr:hypothetical protein [Thermodesulfovibrionales bacterium]